MNSTDPPPANAVHDQMLRVMLSACMSARGILDADAPFDATHNLPTLINTTMRMLERFAETSRESMPWVLAALDAVVRHVSALEALPGGDVPSFAPGDLRWIPGEAYAFAPDFPTPPVPGPRG